MPKYLGTTTSLSGQTGIFEVVECYLCKKLQCVRGTMGGRGFRDDSS
jgi:hypothetical protein